MLRTLINQKRFPHPEKGGLLARKVQRWMEAKIREAASMKNDNSCIMDEIDKRSLLAIFSGNACKVTNIMDSVLSFLPEASFA